MESELTEKEQHVVSVTTAILGGRWRPDPKIYGGAASNPVFLDFVGHDGIVIGWCRVNANEHGLYYAVAYTGRNTSTRGKDFSTIEEAKAWVEEMTFASM